MNQVSEILQRRSAPGVLVFDHEDRLLFANGRALELLTGLTPPEGRPEAIPEEILALCRQVREGEGTALALPSLETEGAGSQGPRSLCTLRALPLGAPGRVHAATHVMVLMERIVEKHQLNLDKARVSYQLSKRETEVLQLVGQGFPNRKIAEMLYLSEHTVKDHLKSIMKKMGAGSRGEVVAALS